MSASGFINALMWAGGFARFHVAQRFLYHLSREKGSRSSAYEVRSRCIPDLTALFN